MTGWWTYGHPKSREYLRRSQSERQLELRWEIFKAVNRANVDLPNRTFGTPNVDRIFSAPPG